MKKQRLAVAPAVLGLILVLAGCDRDGDVASSPSDAATVPTVAASMPATTSDPAATATLRSFEGRDTNHDGFISTAENGAAESKIFNAIDGNQDGTMTVQELDAARVALGLITLPGSDALIADADQDGDHQLTLAEWIAHEGEAFDNADTNKDGKLSKAEYEAQPRLEAPSGTPSAEAESTAGAG